MTMKKGFIANQNFIKELNIVEHIILWLNVGLSLIFFIIQLAWLKAYDKWPTWLAFIASIISIFSVMAGAKQRILCPFLGMVASIFLIFINWNAQNYLMMIMYVLNIFMQLTSLIIWIKTSQDKISINPHHAKWWVCLIYFVVMVGLIALFSWMDGQKWWLEFWSFHLKEVKQPTLAEQIFDACSLIFMIGCFYPQLKKYDQVWYVYILNDVAMLVQWSLKAAYSSDKVVLFNSLTMIVSTLCMTATCILGLINWKKVQLKQKNNK